MTLSITTCSTHTKRIDIYFKCCELFALQKEKKNSNGKFMRNYLAEEKTQFFPFHNVRVMM